MKPKETRKVLEAVQHSAKVLLHDVDIEEKTIHVAAQDILLHIVRPPRVIGKLPVFMFFHGGGWVLGDFPTHERLVRDLVYSSVAVVGNSVGGNNIAAVVSLMAKDPCYAARSCYGRSPTPILIPVHIINLPKAIF